MVEQNLDKQALCFYGYYIKCDKTKKCIKFLGIVCFPPWKCYTNTHSTALLNVQIWPICFKNYENSMVPPQNITTLLRSIEYIHDVYVTTFKYFY